MHERDKTLGKAIHDRRVELGLTQEELAERIGDGVRQSDISRLERDRIQLPRPQRLRAIARALELEAGELLSAAGWDGVAWREAVTESAQEPEQLRQSGRALRPEATIWAFPADTTRDRLAQALENSRHIRAESQHVLDRAQETARSWRRYYGSGDRVPDRSK